MQELIDMLGAQVRPASKIPLREALLFEQIPQGIPWRDCIVGLTEPIGLVARSAASFHCNWPLRSVNQFGKQNSLPWRAILRDPSNLVQAMREGSRPGRCEALSAPCSLDRYQGG
jgi:hypothetical protein